MNYLPRFFMAYLSSVEEMTKNSESFLAMGRINKTEGKAIDHEIIHEVNHVLITRRENQYFIKMTKLSFLCHK